MKKLIQLTSFVLAIIVFANISCKKDQLQPTWLWIKDEMLVIEHMATVHDNNLTKIKEARTTVGEFKWGDDILTLNGPASYYLLADHAIEDLAISFEEDMMPDTTKLSGDTEIERVVSLYLKKKVEYAAKEAYYKLMLTIPKKLYEFNTRWGEIILGGFKWYLTSEIGGDPDNTDGTRKVWAEKILRKLFRSPDKDYKDAWSCNCSPHTYGYYGYLSIAEGPTDKSILTDEELQYLEEQQRIEREDIQEEYAERRYQFFSEKYGGTIDDYRTQYDAERECYYIGIPLYG